MKPWLQTINLTKRYGKNAVIDAINLEIFQGELFTFLGPSGAGKSTIFNCIAGLMYPDDGKVILDGEDITVIPSNQRNIGMVFQDFSLFPSMSVRQNVAFPLEAMEKKGIGNLVKGIFVSSSKKEIDKKVDEALSLVRLEEHAERKPHQLSGGEQQRVALARALVFNPRLLCLDEPLGSLDKNLRYEMQLEIRALQKRLGKTMLYVTHDQSEAFMISDRIAIVNHGRIEQIGTPQALYFRPANSFVALFLGECNTFQIDRTEKVADQYLITTKGGAKFLSLLDANAGEHIIGIRPEGLRISSKEPISERRLKGKVVNVTFSGGQNRIEIELLTGDRLIVQVPTEQNGCSFSAENFLYVDYNPEAILVLPISTNNVY